MSRTDLPAHLSVHDVGPETLSRVADILQRLQGEGIGPVMLLVIPGHDWREQDLNQLREWVDQGHQLAAHGWMHRVEKRRTLWHKFHGTLLSRHVAEHLSLPPSGILELMRRSYAWFQTQKLPAPRHYVPPAWGLGRVSMPELATLPYESVEVLRGVLYPKAGCFRKIPLTGYEADTPLREIFLRGFNQWNHHRALQAGHIRISIHPNDFSLRLAEEILRDCHQYDCGPEFI